jgi:voltage-gated potassium channel
MPQTKVIDRLQIRLGFAPRLGLAAARHEVMRFLRRLAFLIAVVMALVFGGAAAFVIFEDTSYWWGLVWSLDTVATVGAVPHADSLGGEITQIVLITFGVGTMFFLLVTLTELFVAGDLSGLLQARRMQKKIAELRDHYLICGFGRVGRQVSRDFRNAGVEFVVIDDNPEVREALEEHEVLYIDGRGSDDQALLEAGIEHARGMVACIDSDAENIFATLTARELRPDIHIVARAAEEPSERKLRAAGAHDVISPYKTSGTAMARLALGGDRVEELGSENGPASEAIVSGDVAGSAESTSSQ